MSRKKKNHICNSPLISQKLEVDMKKAKEKKNINTKCRFESRTVHVHPS